MAPRARGVTVMVGVVLTLCAAKTGLGEDLSLTTTFFRTEGRRIVAESTGQSWVFRGANLTGLEYGRLACDESPPPPDCYPGLEGTHYFRPRDIDFQAVADRGSNLVRLPFEWARLVPGWQPGMPWPSLNPAYLGLIQQAVTQAAQENLVVVLDMHDFLKYWSGPQQQACLSGSNAHQQLLAHTWKLIAQHFASNTAVLGYDIMNEPVRQEPGEACGSCDWNTIAQPIVNAIRTVDVNHLIFVEGRNYSLSSDWPIENEGPFVTDTVSPPRIVYSPHVYFDSDNDSHYGDEAPPGSWPHYVRDRLWPAISWSVDHDVPIFFGELGVPCSAGWAGVLDYAHRRFFQPLHLSTAAWQYIDPARCPLPACTLNLHGCQQLLDVLGQYPGGPYTESDHFTPPLPHSQIYSDALINPWHDGSFDVQRDFCPSPSPVPPSEGVCLAAAAFDVDFPHGGFKTNHHHGIDTRAYSALSFDIFLTASGQDLRFFTTRPPTGGRNCQPGADPEYPAFGDRPFLSDYLPNATPGQWHRVVVPLDAIVDQDGARVHRTVSGIALQNTQQTQTLYVDDIKLLHRDTIFADGFDITPARWRLPIAN